MESLINVKPGSFITYFHLLPVKRRFVVDMILDNIQPRMSINLKLDEYEEGYPYEEAPS